MHNSQVEPRLLGINDVVAALNISRSLVYELIAAGEIDSVQVGARRLVTPRAIDAYVARLNSQPNTRQLAPTPVRNRRARTVA